MKLLLKKARSISVFILAISLLGCLDDDENKLPKVVSGFTQTIDEDTGTTRFINVSTNANTYLWNFGDEETSTEINPVKSYAASGTYKVTLTATNLAGLSAISEAELIIVVKDIIALPATFDDPLVIYDATVFEGASFNIIDNPAVSGSNDKATKVGALTNVGAEFEGLFFDLGVSADLEFNKSITMNFWSDKAIDVLIKLEKGTGAAVETMASHAGTGWELITFDFESAESFSRLTMFVDGAGTTAGTFYLDDIIQTETIDTTPPVITLLGDAVTSAVLGSTYTDAGATAMDNFDGDISGQIVVSGDMVDTSVEGVYVLTYDVSDLAGNAATTINRTVNVVSVDTVKPVIVLVGDNPFNLTLGAAFTDPGVTATDDVDGNIAANVVITGSVVVATAGTYTLTYNVSDAAGNAADPVTRDVIVAMAAPQNLLINGDFEGGNVAWTGNAFNIVENGGNSFNEANVAAAGAAFDVNISQTVNLTPGATYTLTFDANSDVTRTMIAGIGQSAPPFLANTEVVNLTTMSQTFTYSLVATDDATSADFGDATSRVLFDMGAEVGVVIIDNVSLVLDDGGSGGGGGGGTPGSSLATNGDFETGDDTGWTSFPNGGATFTVTTDEAQAGTFSGKLVAGEGQDVVIKQANLSSGTIAPNTSVTVTFDMLGTLSGAGGVVFAEFFSEISPSGVSKSEIFSGGPLTPTSTWTPYTFTTTTDAVDVSGGITLQLKAACGAVAGCNVEVYFDNVTITVN